MNIDVLIPSDDCVRLISQFVEEMDLTALYGTYERMPAENHASPDIMLKLMIYAYHEGIETSSRTIRMSFNGGWCKTAFNRFQHSFNHPNSH